MKTITVKENGKPIMATERFYVVGVDNNEVKVDSANTSILDLIALVNTIAESIHDNDKIDKHIKDAIGTTFMDVVQRGKEAAIMNQQKGENVQ